ncbi:MAG: alanine--tRNA ligase [Deltaproteobacteria bacterium]|jgi:alanyl-tRNA synthetase|nr:alanine--tRNA ligase [Deltaproteobacteria bacterium]MCL5880161.1 alanine--tRNA ligase [Deltaproteobacteria bacterium]MDA8304789.1 alanine--tRNA ligase [Deltaproteobacteria bacterium]
MKNLLSGELREIFINFFKERGHTFVASSSLIPAGDESIMFTNAGMVQFKEYFTGQVKPPFLRAVTVQKCMRAGGKHNDLENVGRTSRHHTFFEMLGNFSFGDYFKKDAVSFAYEFLKDILEMDENRLYVSVHKKDEEGYSIWRDIIGFDESKIYKLGDDSNFWQMGETGPCGYSSEIFFDTGYSESGHEECDINCDCGRYLEIWNLVFMEFNKERDGSVARLPEPSIDTGMGLERIVRVLQNVKSNYDTDVFKPYISGIDGITGRMYNGGDENYDTAVRVISDHIRTSMFLAAESVFPSNEGRGYVFRRIMRRLIRFSLKLNLTLENLIYLGNIVVITMGGFYPEVRDGIMVFEKIMSEEYDKFNDTVGFGLKLLEEKISELKNNREKIIPGDFIFKLYDTNGFPLDMAIDIASENNLSLDLKRFDELMNVQKSGSKQKKEKFNILDIDLSFPKTNFTGYSNLDAHGKILGFLNESGELTGRLEDGDVCYAISDATPFYPDGGGQSGDKGIIEWEDGSLRVSNTFKTKSGIILHYGRIFGKCTAPAPARFTVDKKNRKKTASNHSATHLLQSALRTVLGSYVVQQGSSVDSERLRFDFTQAKPISDDELRKVESLTNEYIFSDLEVKVEELDVKSALNAGALHFFDEKYEDTVRVVSMGDVSKEFCGGTHVSRTGEIGFFKIMRESSIASGIRRIEAVTGYNYLNQLYIEEDNLNNIASLLGASKPDVYNKIINLYYDYEYLKKENSDIKLKLNTFESERLIREFKNIGPASCVISKFEDSSQDDLKELINILKSRRDFPGGDSAVIFVSLINKERLIYICSAEGNIDASKIVKLLNGQVGGKGGGKRDFAQGGSTDISKFNEIEKILEKVLKDLFLHKIQA